MILMEVITAVLMVTVTIMDMDILTITNIITTIIMITVPA